MHAIRICLINCKIISTHLSQWISENSLCPGSWVVVSTQIWFSFIGLSPWFATFSFIHSPPLAPEFSVLLLSFLPHTWHPPLAWPGSGASSFIVYPVPALSKQPLPVDLRGTDKHTHTGDSHLGRWPVSGQPLQCFRPPHPSLERRGTFSLSLYFLSH